MLVPGAREAPARSQWQLFLRRFLRHRLAVVSLLILVVLYILVSFPHTDRALPAQPQDPGARCTGRRASTGSAPTISAGTS